MNDANTEIAYFDPEGGPFLHVGDDFDGRGKILSFVIEKDAPKDHFKVRVEVEQS
jgi:subtilisin-like proprotein convertase family protein